MSVSRRNRIGRGLQSFASTVMDARKNKDDDDGLNIYPLIQGSIPSNTLGDFDPTKLRKSGTGIYGEDMEALKASLVKIFGI
jgi:hypothetical protein